MYTNFNSKMLDYTFILDASGSMENKIREVRTELNRQLKELKKAHKALGRPCYITINSFDTIHKTLRLSIPIGKVKMVSANEYSSGGLTALYDAIGSAIIGAKSRSGKETKKGTREILIVIFTDGMENASQQYTGSHIQKLLEKYQNKSGWSIALVGTSMSAIQDMASKSFNTGALTFFDDQDTIRAMFKITQKVCSYYKHEDDEFII